MTPICFPTPLSHLHYIYLQYNMNILQLCMTSRGWMFAGIENGQHHLHPGEDEETDWCPAGQLAVFSILSIVFLSSNFLLFYLILSFSFFKFPSFSEIFYPVYISCITIFLIFTNLYHIFLIRTSFLFYKRTTKQKNLPSIIYNLNLYLDFAELFKFKF